MYDELVKRLRCTQLGKCENCKNSYLEQVEPNLYRERCAAIDAADVIEGLQKSNCELLFRVGQAEALIDYYQNTSRWIPVTERLPEMNTSWMPLPEPPKEET